METIHVSVIIAYVVPIRYPGTPIYGAPCIKYA